MKTSRRSLPQITDKVADEPTIVQIGQEAWTRLHLRKPSPEKSLALLKIAGSYSLQRHEAWRQCQHDDPFWDQLPSRGLAAVSRQLCLLGHLEEAHAIVAILMEHPHGPEALSSVTPHYEHGWTKQMEDEFLARYEPRLTVILRREHKMLNVIRHR